MALTLNLDKGEILPDDQVLSIGDKLVGYNDVGEEICFEALRGIEHKGKGYMLLWNGGTDFILSDLQARLVDDTTLIFEIVDPVFSEDCSLPEAS